MRDRARSDRRSDGRTHRSTGEVGALPDVGADRDGVPGAGVGRGERLAAGGRELTEDRGDQLQLRDDLHVAELAHVVVVAVQRPPAGEDVGGVLEEPLAVDHPGALAGMEARLRVGLVDRRPGLLDLQKQGIRAGAALEQHQIDPHPDAAHADDLADDVDHREVIQEAPPVLRQGQPVLGQQVVDQIGLMIIVDRDPDRRVLGDPRPAVGHRGQLGEGSAVGPPLALLLDVDRDRSPVGRLEVPEQAVDMHAVVPDVDLRHRSVLAHPPPVGVDGGGHRGIGDPRLQPVLTGRDHEAGREPLDVPLERAWEGLVEVAQVEHQVALRRRPEAEVEDVCIPAELHRQSAVRPRGEISGHHRRGAAVIVPGRLRHPLMSDRDQVGHADLVLGDDRLERVVAARGLGPASVGATGDPLAGCLAARVALGARRRQVLERMRRGLRCRRVGFHS